MGRRTKYSKELETQICDGLENLKGRVQSVKAAGIHYSTFLDWMDTKPEFTEAVKKAERKARENGKGIAIMSIFNGMKKQWQAGAWWLERNFPDEFKEQKGFGIAGFEKPKPKGKKRKSIVKES